MIRLRALLGCSLLLGASLGCAGWTVDRGMDSHCRPWGETRERGSVACQRTLVIGLFPSIGEAHTNHRATNGKPLSVGLWLADFTLRPLYIAGINLISIGIPTASSWLLEPYDEWDPAPASCRMALLGYCKTGRVAREAEAP